MPSVTFVYCSNAQHEVATAAMDARHAGTATLEGTRSYHVFVPTGEGKLLCGRTTAHPLREEGSVLAPAAPPLRELNYPVLPMEELTAGQYVTLRQETKFVIGQILTTDLTTDTVTLTCLAPLGRHRSYQKPEPAVVVTVPRSDVLVKTEVAPTATKKDKFTIPTAHKDATDAALKERGK